MSKVNSLLGHRMAGSIDNVTFSTAKNGLTTARLKISRKGKKRFSRKQAKQIARWANIIRFWQLFSNKLKPSYEKHDSLRSFFNRFVAANTASTPVYLTKSQAAQGGCVVAPYMVSEGSLPPIQFTQNGQIVSTDIVLGSGFTITSDTTVKQFSEVLVNNNRTDFDYGDQITFYRMVQTFDDGTQTPRVRIYPERIQLSRTDDTTLLRSLVSAYGFSVVNGRLGMGSAVTGGAVYIHSRNIGNRTLVSTQHVVVTHSALAAYGTIEHMLACAGTYGEITDYDYLTPDPEEDADIELPTFDAPNGNSATQSAAPTATLTLRCGTPGTGSFTVDGEPYTAPVELAAGSTVTVHFEAASGYYFVEWRGLDHPEPDYELQVNENTTLIAEVEES